jgi:RNA polymerase sigma factor (sigma-70 family)
MKNKRLISLYTYTFLFITRFLMFFLKKYQKNQKKGLFLHYKTINIPNMPHPDTIYIQALAQHDRVRIKEIYSRFQPKVTRYILNNKGTNDDAADIFQKALIAIYEKTLRGSTDFLNVPFEAYLLQVARFQWLKKLRDTPTSVDIFENSDADTVINDDEAVSKYSNATHDAPDTHIEAEMIAQETVDARNAKLWAYFAQLPDYCQNLLRSRMVDDLTNPQIAEREAQTLNYVTTRISMCLKRLRETIPHAF